MSTDPGSTLQQRVEAMEADRQRKGRRVSGHRLFMQQVPVPEVEPPPAPAKPKPSKPAKPTTQQVILEQVVKALAGHYAQKAVSQAKRGTPLDRLLAAHQPKKKPASNGRSV